MDIGTCVHEHDMFGDGLHHNMMYECDCERCALTRIFKMLKLNMVHTVIGMHDMHDLTHPN